MIGTECDALTASYAEGVKDGKWQAGQLLKLAYLDRDIWKQRAESKMAIWRETLEKCARYTEHRAGCEMAERPGNAKPCTCGLDAALSAAKELLEVKP